ncbi:MAG: lipopolysaccharide assembly protein LapA domain-containing protein [Brachybacterium sp.]|nr:lipopolysaccharide assembly protein LapA domain-containing protein [Brachybacterium sp.]
MTTPSNESRPVGRDGEYAPGSDARRFVDGENDQDRRAETHRDDTRQDERRREDTHRDDRRREDTRREEPATDEVTTGGSRTGGVWAALILGAIVLIMLLIFVVQNSARTNFEYITWTFALPLGVAMLLAAIAGALVMALVGSVRMFQMSRTIKKLRKNEAQIRKALRDR